MATKPNYHLLTYSEVAALLNTNHETGLSASFAKDKLATDGPNQLSHDSSGNLLHIIFLNFESGVLIAVMVVNSGIGIFQEAKSEKTMDALRKMASPTAKVLRDRQVTVIPTREVVVGDICLIELGDVVPADVRLVEAVNLEVDEALLTGEAVPVSKITTPCTNTDSSTDKPNSCFSSTTVTSGRGLGIVTATALDTEIGKIAELVNGKKNKKKINLPKSEQTPLQKSLHRMMYLCFAFACVLSVIVFGANQFQFKNEILLYAVAVSVAIIPEGLPTVIVLTMALGVKKMAKQKAIVRKLVALEALGQVTNICSDKTGTLTEGKMVAKCLWIGKNKYEVTGKGIEPVGEFIKQPDGIKIVPEEVSKDKALYEALLTCTFCSTSTLFYCEESKTWKANGSPTEIALQVLSKKVSITKESFPGSTFLAEFPFDSSLKRMTVSIVDNEGNTHNYTKGALERIFEISTSYYDNNGNVVDLTEEFKHEAEEVMLGMASNGWRVLAIAQKIEKSINNFDSVRTNLNAPKRVEVECDMTFIGLVAVYDPPRVESKPSVLACHNAGIVVHMATGDHFKTAEAIAIEVGIIKPEEVQQKNLIIEGNNFDNMNDEEIDALPELPRVLARCSPSTKVKMIEALHRRDKFVCMTGDGVNDAPAVKNSDIGIVMGLGGSDVTKQASAITLADDNFATILVAIKEGRRIFANTGRVALHLLSGNVSEVVCLVFGLAIQDTSYRSVFPMSAIQILWLNMVTSTPVALALGMERASKDLMIQRPRKKSEGLWSKELILDTMFYGIVIGVMSLSCFIIAISAAKPNNLGFVNIPSGCNHDISDECNYIFQARALTFYCHCFLLLLHGYVCRHSRETFFSKSLLSNKYLNIACTIGVCLVVPTAYLGFVSPLIFAQTAFDWGWGIIFGFCFIYILICDVYKYFKRRHFRVDESSVAV
ncbi:hypothetical protein HDU92_007496, partial [Lobulomyces angularis]